MGSSRYRQNSSARGERTELRESDRTTTAAVVASHSCGVAAAMWIYVGRGAFKSGRLFVELLLPGFHFDLQPVVRRRERARPAVVARTVRIVRFGSANPHCGSPHSLRSEECENRRELGGGQSANYPIVKSGGAANSPLLFFQPFPFTISAITSKIFVKCPTSTSAKSGSFFRMYSA
jgi:hypothetical protein